MKACSTSRRILFEPKIRPLPRKRLEPCPYAIHQRSSLLQKRNYKFTLSKLCSLKKHFQPHSRLLSTSPHYGGNPDLVIFQLRHRSLLAVTGPEAASFLQGLTTNSIPFDVSVDGKSSDAIPQVLSSAFLNAQGRLLQDVLIYTLPQSSSLWHSMGVELKKDDSSVPGYLIEVDSEQLTNLSKSLRRYRLRSKVTLSQVDPQTATVLSIWNEGAGQDIPLSVIEPLKGKAIQVARDNRAPGFGYRAIVPSVEVGMLGDARIASVDEYRVRRYLHSIPEGQAELPCESSLIHESNLDYMHGVDFRKGCYVGQELVIRTQHTGVVRKRILPVMLYRAGTEAPTALKSNASTSDFPSIPYGTDIKKAEETGSSGRKPRSAGKWVANVGNIGLAMARLETMVGLGPTGEKLEGWQAPELIVDHDDSHDGKLRAKAFVPDWWNERRILKP